MSNVVYKQHTNISSKVYKNMCFSTFYLNFATLSCTFKKFIFCGFAKIHLGNVFKTSICCEYLAFKCHILGAKPLFRNIRKSKSPCSALTKSGKNTKNLKKIRILKKKWHLFWKHNWKQVNFSDQKWEFTCFWWTQMLLNGEKTENGVCKYGLLQVMKAIEESTSWFGQSEKKRV